MEKRIENLEINPNNNKSGIKLLSYMDKDFLETNSNGEVVSKNIVLSYNNGKISVEGGNTIVIPKGITAEQEVYLNEKINAPTGQYKIEPKANCNFYNGDWHLRRILNVKNGFGYIHLDFTVTGLLYFNNLAELPDNAPTPSELLEVQAFNGVTVRIEKNSRKIKANVDSSQRNQRIILNLWSFFS